MPGITEIKYGSEIHKTTLTGLLLRYNSARDEMQKKYKDWKAAEDLFAAYVQPNQDDRIRSNTRDQGNPQYTTLTVPISYALLMTYHTYLSAVFMGRDPILQYMGRNGGPEQSSQAVEAIIAYQLLVGKMMVPLYLWLMDAPKYGFGTIGIYWKDEMATVSRIVERPKMFMGTIPIPGKTEKVKQTDTIRGYSGNKIYNVSPWDVFFDPRVPLVEFQRGEFMGRQTKLSWSEMVNDGNYYNLDAVKTILTSPSIAMERYNNPEARGNVQTLDTNYNPRWTGDKGFYQIIEIYANVIPKDWGLGEGDKPEKWVFTIAERQVIIGGRPCGYYHNQYPFAVQQYEFNAYDLTSRGLMEMSKPMSDATSWLMNSHFYNVRKALNDQVIYDPSKIYGKDLEEGGPGKQIRLRPSAYGTDPAMAIKQLQIVDVTRSHLADLQLMTEIMQRTFGITDNVMGMVNDGGRKTATEIRTSSSFSVNRLKTQAEYNASLGWDPLAQILLQNTQQMYDEQKQFRIAGDLSPNGPIFMDVSPESIMGFYDFVPVDGTMPVDRMAQAMLWKEILTEIIQFPPLAQGYDIPGMFAWMAQLAGLKNIKKFKINVVPDQQMQQQVQAGNLVPAASPQGLPAAGVTGGNGSGQP